MTSTLSSFPTAPCFMTSPMTLPTIPSRLFWRPGDALMTVRIALTPRFESYTKGSANPFESAALPICSMKFSKSKIGTPCRSSGTLPTLSPLKKAGCESFQKNIGEELVFRFTPTSAPTLWIKRWWITSKTGCACQWPWAWKPVIRNFATAF